MKYRRKFGWMILAFIAFAVLVSFVTMALWNWLVPVLFNGPYITVFQAAGILILAKIIFGFGKGSWKSGGRHYRKHHMSPEEKEMYRKKFMERCGWTPPKDSEAPAAEIVPGRGRFESGALGMFFGKVLWIQRLIDDSNREEEEIIKLQLPSW